MDECLTAPGGEVSPEAEAASGELQGRLLVLDQEQPVAAAQIGEPFTGDVLLDAGGLLSGLLLGELAV